MKKSILAAAIAAAGAVASAASAQDKAVEWKLSHYLPPTHPLSQAFLPWTESLSKATGGTLKVTVYPSEQLGKAFDGYNTARDGIAEVSLMSPGYTPGRFPIGNATALPFLISNGDTGTRAVDEWYRKYAATEMKDVKYCIGFVHDPGALHLAKKKVVLPADMKGLKIRPAGGTVGAFMVQLGATTVNASPPEARQVLERGVADGITFPWNSIIIFRIDQVVKFHMNVPFYTSHQMFVINKAAYDKLADGQKKAVDEHCSPDWAVKVVSPWNKWEAEGRAKMKGLDGHEVYDLTPAQIAEWRKAADTMHQTWADTVKKAGGDPKAAMDELQAALKKHNAAY